MRTDNKISILFVCMGNICRSPSCEGVFQYYVADKGYAEQLYIDSAGTISYHAGEPADARMREVAARQGYQLSSRARKVTLIWLWQWIRITCVRWSQCWAVLHNTCVY
jgi:protein-tyrosine phosphatase